MTSNLDARLYKRFHENRPRSRASSYLGLLRITGGCAIFSLGVIISCGLSPPHPLPIPIMPILAAASVSKIIFGAIGARVAAILAIGTGAILAYPQIYEWPPSQAIWCGAFIIVFAGYLVPDWKA